MPRRERLRMKNRHKGTGAADRKSFCLQEAGALLVPGSAQTSSTTTQANRERNRSCLSFCVARWEEHTSELQPRFGMSYAAFFFNDTATTEIYTLSLHDALPICPRKCTNIIDNNASQPRAKPKLPILLCC